MNKTLWQDDAPADTRRERRKQEIRTRIIEAAIMLFEDRGLEPVTLEEICEQAAISRPTFYSYFTSKQELIQALAEKLWLNVAREVTDNALAQQTSVIEFLRAFFAATRREITRYGRLERELVRYSMRGESADDQRNSGMLKIMTALFHSIYTRGRKAGEIGDRYPVDFLAEVTMGCISSMMMNWAFDADYPVEKRMKQTADFIISMLALKK